jgi:protein phosphatase PTC2/3
MEDAHTAVLDLQQRCDQEEDRPEGRIPSGLSFFGVFDGHGGSEVAEYSGTNMVRLISDSLVAGERNYGALLSSVFLQTDQNILKGA